MRHKEPSPAVGADEAAAYTTDQTKAQLQALYAQHQGAEDATLQQLSAAIAALRARGAVGRDELDIHVQACVSGRSNTRLFHGRPKVSFLVHDVSAPAQLAPLLERLAPCQAAVALEVVVTADHPAAWADAARDAEGTAGAVSVVPIFAAPQGQLEGFNQAARVARGEVLILLALDDLPKATCGWLKDAVSTFERWPDVGVLGWRRHQLCGHGEDAASRQRVWFQDPKSDVPMQFVAHVDMLPLALRRSALLRVGGLDDTLVDSATTAQAAPMAACVAGAADTRPDQELCRRMWVAGFQVVATIHDAWSLGGSGAPARPQCAPDPRASPDGADNAPRRRREQALEGDVCDAARRLNVAHLALTAGGKCPYRAGCDPPRP